MIDLLEYIKIQWEDIHHSRNQEWRVLAIIIGIFYALFNINPASYNELHIAITILGLIACGMGVYMSVIHWFLFYNKLHVISACEKELGLEVNFYKPPFAVQGLILLSYFFVASILIGWLTWLISETIWISYFIFTLCFLIGFSICIIIKIRIQKKIEENTSITFKKGKKNEEKPKTTVSINSGIE
ncbi:MAG: hypothetical protein PHX78_03165 [bacterium]|nr:hypothetical protein [bacterium]